MNEKFAISENTKLILLRLFFVIVSIAVVVASVVVINKRSVKVEATTAPTVLTTETTTEEETTEEETTEEETTEESPFVNLSVSTLQSDLRIRFHNRVGTLIKGQAFEVSVTYPNGEKKNFKDEDKDGRINITSLKAGSYKVVLDVPEGYESQRKELTLAVKDTVEYKVVKDVKDDIKKSSEVNLNKEQAKPKKQATESKLKDTVAFVTSSKTENVEYVLVPTKNINIVIEDETTTVEPTTEDMGEETSAPEESTSEEITTTTKPTTTKKPSQLKDKSGNPLYEKVGSTYKLVNDNEFSKDKEYYKKVVTIKYTGWQVIDGKTYYYDKNGKPVTGNQVISGAKYSFDGNGVLKKGFGVLGIDVSTFQRSIDWKKVKASGINFAILRCGFRGYGSGAIVEDNRFKENLAGTKAVGMDIGVYFYSQAINEAEAVEEASACISLLGGRRIKYPIYIDMENTGTGGQGRADNISKETRTKVAIAFCETIKKGGYMPGVYTNKYYSIYCLDMSRLNKYNVWLAHYTTKTDYAGPYNMWQYSSTGTVPGIEGNVDMNLSYMY